MIVLFQFPGGVWRPGIGDPTPLGWLTVVAYLFTAGLCLRAGQQARQRGDTQRPALAWTGLAALLLLLGANKQLDLQVLLTDVGKYLALRGGWYAQRHAVQFWFVGGLLAAGGSSVAAGMWWLRAHLPQFRLAGLGVLLLVAFVLVRAAWFNHIGPGSGRGLHFALELAGIAFIAANARQFLRRMHARGAG